MRYNHILEEYYKHFENGFEAGVKYLSERSKEKATENYSDNLAMAVDIDEIDEITQEALSKGEQ